MADASTLDPANGNGLGTVVAQQARAGAVGGLFDGGRAMLAARAR